MFIFRLVNLCSGYCFADTVANGFKIIAVLSSALSFKEIFSLVPRKLCLPSANIRLNPTRSLTFGG